MADAPDDRDVKLQQHSGDLFAWFKSTLAKVLFADGAELGLEVSGIKVAERSINWIVLTRDVEAARAILEPFQEAPQVVDLHLVSILTPISSCLLYYFTNPPPATSDSIPPGSQTLAEALGLLVYILCKIRGYKVVSRFFPNEPHLLQTIISRLAFPHTAIGADPLEAAVDRSWELRFVVLLWLGHLLLAPFDLSTISSCSTEDRPPVDISAFIPSPDSPFPERLAALPQLCKTILLLATKTLLSPSPRENHAAALVIVRLAIRRDMRALGLLEAVVEWCLRCWEDPPKEGEERDIDLLSTHDPTINPLFLRTGALQVLAGLLTSSETAWVKGHILKIWRLVTGVEDKAGAEWTTDEANAGEWASSGVRKVAIKIYKCIGILLLAGGAAEQEQSREVVEDVVGRLLNLLGDRDTNVRLAASKSLGILTSKLPEEMASEVVNAVVAGFDEDVLYETQSEMPYSQGQSIPLLFGDQLDATLEKKQLLVSVSPEKWHGLTLTLATLLRQRAIKPHAPSLDKEGEAESTIPLFQLIVDRILTALAFEQRRTTFSLGSNVRDAACYAAWALARSYYTHELLVIPLPEQYAKYPDPVHTLPNIIQLLATNLITTACLDPVGNIRRASSAALQELVGRHPNVVEEGIRVVQTVDYGGVSARRRAVTEVARDAARLGKGGYWFGLARGLVEGWRGVGNGDVEGRRIAASGLGAMVGVKLENDTCEQIITRGRRLVGWLLNRAAKEAQKDVEVRHGVYYSLAHVLEGLGSLVSNITSTDSVAVFSPLQQSLLLDIFHPLCGRDFVHPPLRPDLTAESATRLVAALCRISLPNSLCKNQLISSKLPISTHRLNLAILEATLEFRGEDPVLDQVIPATREVFRTLGWATGQDAVRGWCRRIMSEGLTTGETGPAAPLAGGSGLGRKRGFVGGLGEVVGVMLSDYDYLKSGDGAVKLIEEGIRVLVEAAKKRGNVEMRVAGVRGMRRGVLSFPPFKYSSVSGAGESPEWLPSVISALCAALDDYSIDTRGDVGSWVRAEAIEAVVQGYKSGVINFGVRIPNAANKEFGADEGEVVDVMTPLLQRLLRLSVEKLDRLRSKAYFALKEILYHPDQESIGGGGGDVVADLGKYITFTHPTEVYVDATLPEYFLSLLPLLTHPSEKLTQALISGLVLSTGGGSDSLLRAAGQALWGYLERQTDEVVLHVGGALIRNLEQGEERTVVQTLETLGGGLEAGVFGRIVGVEGWGKKCAAAVWGIGRSAGGDGKGNTGTGARKNAAKGGGGVQRIISQVRVYRGLGVGGLWWGLRRGAAKVDGEDDKSEGTRVRNLMGRRLVALLGHTWPVVRREAGEALVVVLGLGMGMDGLGGVEEGWGKPGQEGVDVQGAMEVLLETDWMGRLEPGKKGERGVKAEVERVRKLLGFV